jgi:hypothetical protein
VVVAARGASTLVSWHADDPEQVVSWLAPTGWWCARSCNAVWCASVGAWNSEEDLIA